MDKRDRNAHTRNVLPKVWAISLAAFALAAAGAVGAPSAVQPSLKLVGFAAILDNDDHVVRAKAGGTLTRCDDPRAFSVVLDVANVKRGLPYLVAWTLNGKVVYSGSGSSGSFDAKPDRVALGFRKSKVLPRGTYTFRMAINGIVRARGTVTRNCAS